MRKPLSSAFIVFCCVAAATAWPREEYRREFRKTTALAAGRTFRIENSNGSLTIRTQAKAEVQILASIRCSAATESEARKYCDQIQIAVEEAGGVSVLTEYPSHWNTGNLSYSVNYDVTVPESSPIEVRNRFGAVTVSNPHAGSVINNANGAVSVSGGRGRQQIENSFGSVSVQTNDGEVSVRNGNGDVAASDVTGAIDIGNRFGKVRVTNAGRGVTIHSNNGNIEVVNVAGILSAANSFGPVVVSDVRGDVIVQNENGEVRATGLEGSAELRTTFGEVNFSRVGKALTVHAANAAVAGDTVGQSATVETTFGNVDLRDVKGGARVTAGNSGIRLTDIGGEVYAKTSFGGVTVTGAAGAITVENQNGSVTAEAKPGQQCRPISLHTSFGPIQAAIPAGIGYNVTARTSFGRIHSDAGMTVTGDISAGSVTGKISGGGCELRLLDQNGDITIVKR